MTYDPFSAHSAGVTAPALGSVAIVPDDDADLATVVRSITIGGLPGTIRYVSARDGQICETNSLPLGQHPIWAVRVLATGTTATDLTGWI